MSWLAVLSVVLCCSTLVLSDAEANRVEFVGKYTEALETLGMSEDQIDAPAADPLPNTKGARLQCDELNSKEPETVHELTPDQVDVVAAMGDSITAAFGARTTRLISFRDKLITEFRGVSWSIGGEGMIDTVVTLPNAIEQFNEDLIGFSTGETKFLIGGILGQDPLVAGLNVAETGARTDDILEQAQTLVSRMNEQGVTDEQWKVITLWIGANDLCDIRKWSNANNEAELYTVNVRQALDYLSANVKRAFINVVQMIDLAELSGLSRFDCDTIRLLVCNGVSIRASRRIVTEAARLYNQRLEALIANGETYDRDDFTVVLQPFFTETPLPRLVNGAPDFDYFAPDCFHFSQLGHSVVATYLWNNMFEPVGKKTTEIDWNNLQPLKCPQENGPRFATYKNSKSNSGKSALLDSGSNVVEGGSSSSALTTTSSLSFLVAAVAAVILSQLL